MSEQACPKCGAYGGHECRPQATDWCPKDIEQLRAENERILKLCNLRNHEATLAVETCQKWLARAGELESENARLRAALEDIAEETGTPYARIAREALGSTKESK